MPLDPKFLILWPSEKVGNEYNRLQANIAIMVNLTTFSGGHKIGSLGARDLILFLK